MATGCYIVQLKFYVQAFHFMRFCSADDRNFARCPATNPHCTIISDHNVFLMYHLLAGRKLSLPGFVVTLVATWYGGILGIGENTYSYGIQTWFIFGLPYYIFAILFAFLIAGRINETKFISIPAQFHGRFGKTAGVVSALYILFLASPAPYILSIGILLQFTTGLSFGLSLLMATGLSLSYIWIGGFKAVVRTDGLQFGFMFAGFILLLIFSMKSAGTFSERPYIRNSIAGIPFKYNRRCVYTIHCCLVFYCFVDFRRSGILPAVRCRQITPDCQKRYINFHWILVHF